MASPSPMLLPPPSVIDDTHKVYSIAIWCIFLCVLTSLCVLLRLGYRIQTRAFGIEDWAIIPALLLYIGWSAMAAYVNLHAGVGKPLWEITVGEFSVWFKGIIGSAWLYPAMSCSIRVSIILFYQRIFVTPLSRLKHVIWLLLAIQAVYLVVYSILPAFICRPLYKAWDPIERPLYFDDFYYYYTQVALYSTSMVFDAVLLFFPIYPISKLHMPLKRRVAISVLFMFGAAASIVAAYKLAIFVIEMTRYYSINPQWAQYELSREIPPQFDTYGRTFWIPSQAEPTVALIGTSLPALRQMYVLGQQQISRAWSQYSVSRSAGKSGIEPGESRVTHLSARGQDSRKKKGSEIGSHSEYLQLDDWSKTSQS